jgi:hypothetical protein
MKRIGESFLLLLAGGSVAVILLLAGLVPVMVYWQWSASKSVLVKPFASGIIIVDQGRKADFIDMVERFSDENGFERHMTVDNIDRSRLYFALFRGDQYIYIVNSRNRSEFEVDLFVNSNGVGDDRLADAFFSAMKRGLGDAAVRH